MMQYNKLKSNDIKLTIGLPFFSYFMYVFFVWMCDAADFMCYLTELTQATILSRILILGIIVGLLIVAKRYFSIEYLKKQKVFYWILFALFLYAIISSAVPNSEGDSWGTHFPNIFPGFYDNINDSVFDKGLGSFMFPLNDRVFYWFYILLGYRLSSLLNFIVIAISYGMISEILKMLTTNSNENKSEEIYLHNTDKRGFVLSLFVPEFFSFLIICTFYIMSNIGIYMVDMIAVPFMLEMLRITILVLQNKNKYANTNFMFIYFAIITGLVVAMKLTNIIFAIPLLFLFLIIERKNIRIPIFLICTLIGVIPITPYISYAYVSTGNPVYPFYNGFFKSPYWGIGDFKDSRWGPQNFLQSFLWPMQSVIKPSQRLSEMAPICQCSIILGLISSAIIFLKRKTYNNKVYNLLIIVFLIQTYLWVFTTGYARYTVFIEIFAGIIIYCAAFNTKLLNKNIISILLVLAMLVQSTVTIAQISYFGKGWSGKPSILRQYSYYAENLSEIFKDKGSIGTKEQREKVDCFIQLNYFFALDRLLNPEGKEFNLTYLHHPAFTIDLINPKYVQEQTERLMKYQNEGAGIYSIIPNNHYHIIADLANSANAYIYDIEYLPSYFEPYYYLLLVETGIEEDRENELIYVSNPSREFHIKNTGNKVSIKGIVAITAEIAKYYGTTLFEIEAIDKKRSKIIYSQEVDPLNFYNLDFELDLSGMQEDVEIVFKHKYLDGSEIVDEHLTILNPEVIER